MRRSRLRRRGRLLHRRGRARSRNDKQEEQAGGGEEYALYAAQHVFCTHIEHQNLREEDGKVTRPAAKDKGDGQPEEEEKEHRGKAELNPGAEILVVRVITPFYEHHPAISFKFLEQIIGALPDTNTVKRIFSGAFERSVPDGVTGLDRGSDGVVGYAEIFAQRHLVEAGVELHNAEGGKGDKGNDSRHAPKPPGGRKGEESSRGKDGDGVDNRLARAGPVKSKAQDDKSESGENESAHPAERGDILLRKHDDGGETETEKSGILEAVLEVEREVGEVQPVEGEVEVVVTIDGVQVVPNPVMGEEIDKDGDEAGGDKDLEAGLPVVAFIEPPESRKEEEEKVEVTHQRAIGSLLIISPQERDNAPEEPDCKPDKGNEPAAFSSASGGGSAGEGKGLGKETELQQPRYEPDHPNGARETMAVREHCEKGEERVPVDFAYDLLIFGKKLHRCLIRN